MERSVNSLLEYARPEQGERAAFAIQNVIRKTVQLVDGRCKQQRVKLTIACQDSPMMLEGDASQIQQLLLNLILNALDAMPDGGELTVQASANRERLELSVIDTGDGIREDMLDKLFVPFSTSKPAGVGLGLGICRRIASSHGGSLTGQNRLERGAEFRLSLPLYVSESSVSESIEAKESLNREASCKAC
jgi:signal transduction histidine kinase